jgi:transposase
MQSQDAAKIVGLHAGSVKNIWMTFQKKGVDGLLGERRGQARGKAHLSLEEEEALLAPFEAGAARGALTVAQRIHQTHCKAVGKDLDETVTYRMLKRHGWRKVVPRPHHPKQNKSDQEAFQVFFPQDSDARKSGGGASWMPVSLDVSG